MTDDWERNFRRGPMTAQELEDEIARLVREDAEYRAAVEAKQQRRQERRASMRAAQEPVLADLRAVGTDVESVWDLVNSAEDYAPALPTLLAHLEDGSYPDRVNEGLGRALGVPCSVQWWDRLKQVYVASANGREKGAAVALAVCATKQQLEDLISLASMHDKGDSRVLFLRPIKKLGGVRGRQFLETLRGDPLLGLEATALTKQRKKP